ncbi:hypothetical protein ACHQM5_019468 [Ranunculus cassubicifolius]
MVVTAGVSDTAIAVRDKLKGKIGQSKVKRYWPGKAPEWADDAEDDEDGDLTRPRRYSVEEGFPRGEDDPRLRRLKENKVDNKDEIRADHRRIRQAEIVSTAEEESERIERMELEEEDEDALEERRRRIKERLLQREKEEVALLPVEDEDENVETEEEDESEFETDSDEDTAGPVMHKPVFIPKKERETIAERERMEAEELALKKMVETRLEERKIETKKIVIAEIQKDLEIQKNLDMEAQLADVNTDDEMDQKEDYDAWQVREMARIKRDKGDRVAMAKEKEEVEKVRNMTERERREWAWNNPKPLPQPKGKWKYMQKYYHKGAFFQADADDSAGTAGVDSIYRRDYSAPTGEDKLNKTLLPKVMQVKHFGKSGRTKWTHLGNEDTTDWNNPWTYNGNLRKKYNHMMAGMKPIERPRGSKKMKDWESY